MIRSMNLEAWSHSPSAISLNSFERGSELIPVAILLKYRYRKAAKVSPARAWLRSSRSVGSFLTDKTGRTIAWSPGVFLALFQQPDVVEITKQNAGGTEILNVSSRATSALLSAYLTLVRPPNTIMIGLAVVIGEAIGLGKLPGLREAVFGFLTASLMMAGTMVANDVYDVEIDKVNSPQRPLPSGTVKTGDATLLAVALSVAAMGFSALLGLWTFLTALLALALMVYYNTKGKKTGLIGNAVVSFNVALPFFYGGLAVSKISPLLFIFSVVAFLANFGREVAKGIVDVKGDSLRQVRTLAVVRGTKVAASASAALFVIAVLLSFLPPFLESISWLYYPPVIVADVGFLYSSYRLMSNQTPENIRSVKGHVLLWMLLGLVGFLLGGAALV